ncbi:MAG: hypothetical protein LUE14_06450, partial [Clostridiales bacterium]|nr:hypothetical protein [Clostridiales bacterium]
RKSQGFFVQEKSIWQRGCKSKGFIDKVKFLTFIKLMGSYSEEFRFTKVLYLKLTRLPGPPQDLRTCLSGRRQNKKEDIYGQKRNSIHGKNHPGRPPH